MWETWSYLDKKQRYLLFQKDWRPTKNKSSTVQITALREHMNTTIIYHRNSILVSLFSKEPTRNQPATCHHRDINNWQWDCECFNFPLTLVLLPLLPLGRPRPYPLPLQTWPYQRRSRPAFPASVLVRHDSMHNGRNFDREANQGVSSCAWLFLVF